MFTEYVDKFRKRHKNIYCLKEEYITRDQIWFPGWYFSDGTETLNGPFETFEETVELLNNWNG